MAAKYDDPEVDSSEDSQLRIVIELAVYSDYQFITMGMAVDSHLCDNNNSSQTSGFNSNSGG